MMQSFSLALGALTTREVDLAKSFFALLDLDGVTYFSSDNFRRYKLDRYFRKPDKEIGLFFMKLKAQDFIQSFGELPSRIESNHFRKNDMFFRTGKFERWLREQQTLNSL